MSGVNRATRDFSKFYPATVSYYDDLRGYGFVQSPEIDKDVLVVAALLNRRGIETVQKGQAVNVRYITRPDGRYMATGIYLR